MREEPIVPQPARANNGDTLDVTCGPEIKNFASIAKGDVVKAKYTETLMVHVEPEGTPRRCMVAGSLLREDVPRDGLGEV